GKAAKIAKNEWMAASCSDSIIREGLARNERLRSPADHRRRIEELGHCATPGFARRWNTMVDRAPAFACAVGAIVGPIGCSASNHSTSWAASRINRPTARRRDQLERLAASTERPRSLRSRRRARWPAATALHHEKNGESSRLGVNSGADCARNCVAVLGSALSCATAGHSLCVQSAIREEGCVKSRFLELRTTLVWRQCTSAGVPVKFLETGKNQNY